MNEKNTNTINFKGVHNGHEQTYNWARSFLKNCNFMRAKENLGFTLLNENEMSIDFLWRRYIINKEAVEQKGEIKNYASSAVMDFNIKSLLCYYAIGPDWDEQNPYKFKPLPESDFAPLSAFSGGTFAGGGTFKRDASSKRLSDVYGDDYKKFEAHANDAGMLFIESRGDGKYLWQYDLLPRITIQLAYYQGDDEFPTEIKTLFPRNVLDFFKFEPLAVLGGCFAEAFASIGKT
ncbi:MAG: hypothetical protein Ta2G_04900 [Termitinemataceae bacterium]|nr:MAG: hypothetical protein Ta2G_04900 [Termitinemataceae bacterium]